MGYCRRPECRNTCKSITYNACSNPSLPAILQKPLRNHGLLLFREQRRLVTGLDTSSLCAYRIIWFVPLPAFSISPEGPRRSARRHRLACRQGQPAHARPDCGARLRACVVAAIYSMCEGSPPCRNRHRSLISWRRSIPKKSGRYELERDPATRTLTRLRTHGSAADDAAPQAQFGNASILRDGRVVFNIGGKSIASSSGSTIRIAWCTFASLALMSNTSALKPQRAA